ncbi:MAG: NUDIX hydrolase [bacterium]|nr:NUDIX hydrolase [bacterium]
MDEDQKTIATVGVVVFKNDDPESVCLVEHLAGAHHMTGTYGLPAGKIELGETPLNAAVREMREETGLVATSEDMLFLKRYFAEIEQKDGVKKFSWDVFVCREYSGDFKESEETKPQWVRLEDFVKINRFLPNVKNAVEEAQQIIEIRK